MGIARIVHAVASVQRGAVPRFAGVARRFGLPPYAYQHDVFGDGSIFVDFPWLDEKVAVEVKGFDSHGTPQAMTDDFEREHTG